MNTRKRSKPLPKGIPRTSNSVIRLGSLRQAFAAIALVFPTVGLAGIGDILDNLRNYDLNDYALGVAYTSSQNPFLGGSTSGFAYPYLTSFRHAAFTDDWLILTGGELGFRWVNDKGWILGAVGRINTMSSGSSTLEELLGLDVREWVTEVSPLVGYRRWPVHLDAKYFVPVFSERGGPSAEFSASLPFEFDWGWLVPDVTLIASSAERNNYYFGISPTDDLPGIADYQPGSSEHISLGLNFGYAIAAKWKLTGSIRHEWLPDEVSNSPLVARDALWHWSLGIAYNNDIFRSPGTPLESFRAPGFEFRAGIYSNNISSKIIQLPSDGGPAEEIELEDVFGVDRRDNILNLEAIWRFGHYHRFQVGRFALGRESTTTLLTDLQIGDEVFPAGVEIDVESDIEVIRFGYGFSLMNDAQKELGILVGIHKTDAQTLVRSEETGQEVSSRANTPLPVIGVFGSVALTERIDLGANVEIFRMEFDTYDGSLNAFNLNLTYFFTERLGAGIGYNYFSMDLDSPEEGLRGSTQIRHHGPIVFATFTF